MSISTNKNILPGPEATIIANRSQLDGFRPDRLLIKNADRWFVRDVLVEGRSQLNQIAPRGLPGAVFRDTFYPPRFWSDDVKAGESIGVVVSYIGDRETGEPFEGAVFGVEDPPPRTPGTLAGRADPSSTEWSSARVTLSTLSDDWVVHGVMVENRSQFANCGDLPGAAFSSIVVDGAMTMDPVRPEIDLTIEYSYFGASESGAPFVCGVYGDVVDLGRPWSAELRRLVRSGPSPDAVAWRAQRAHDRGVGWGRRVARRVPPVVPSVPALRPPAGRLH